MLNKYLFIFLFFPTFLYAEMIGGFNFGEEFKNWKKYKELEEKSLPHEFLVEKVKFFDNAQVGTDESKKIRSLAFIKEYHVNVYNVRVRKVQIAEDFKKVVKTIESRYGTFDKSKANNILGLVGETNTFYLGEIAEKAQNRQPKSNKLGGIYLLLKSKEDKDVIFGSEKTVTLILVYFDKKMMKSIIEKEESELRGF